MRAKLDPSHPSSHPSHHTFGPHSTSPFAATVVILKTFHSSLFTHLSLSPSFPEQSMSMSTLTRLMLCFFFSFLLSSPFTAEAGGSIGVNYGRVANDLPSAVKVVQLLKSQGLDRVKLYDTDPAVLRALSGSGIKVVVALPNELLSAVARRPSQAYTWVQKNKAAYHPATQIHAIAVGNEVFVDTHNTTTFLVPAMTNIHAALIRLNLDDAIKVSSPIALSCLQSSYPSSAGPFKSNLVEPVIKPMLQFLRQTGSFLMTNTRNMLKKATSTQFTMCITVGVKFRGGVGPTSETIRIANCTRECPCYACVFS